MIWPYYMAAPPSKVAKLIIIDGFGGICETDQGADKLRLEDLPFAGDLAPYILTDKLIWNGIKPSFHDESATNNRFFQTMKDLFSIKGSRRTKLEILPFMQG